MKQLKLIEIAEPNWLDITIEWLLEYLQNEYPEMKFQLFTYGYSVEINQTFTKKGHLAFSINKDADLDIWKNPVIIHMGVSKQYGDWCGRGEAVNNITEFKARLPIYINSCKQHAKNYNKTKEVKNDK